jgi:hypothetical protein
MTYIDRFASECGAENVYQMLSRARQELEHRFPDDERREIPRVLAAFEAIDEAMRATRRLRDIFKGNGTQTVADFMPDDTGFSVNDRQMNPNCDKF